MMLIKLLGIDLRGLTHLRSGVAGAKDTRAACFEIAFPTFNGSQKLGGKLSFIVEIIRQPVLQLQRGVTRELFDVILDGLKDWHG